MFMETNFDIFEIINKEMSILIGMQEIYYKSCLKFKNPTKTFKGMCLLDNKRFLDLIATFIGSVISRLPLRSFKCLEAS